jgi:hypothetical protein
MDGYGKIEEAYYVMCRSGDHHYTWPKKAGREDEFAYSLPYFGWKLSKRGYWSCPTCVAKRKKSKSNLTPISLSS